MEIALASCTFFPVNMINQEFNTILQGLEVQLDRKLQHAKCHRPSDAMTDPETQGELSDKSLQCLLSISPTQKNIPIFFFLFCMQLLLTNSIVSQNPESLFYDRWIPRETEEQNKFSFKSEWNRLNLIPNKGRLIFVFKCSLSLGLAVFCGLLFNRQYGYWSGLTITISFVTGRHPILTTSNARAQGTAMGSVYGVLGCFIFHNLTEMRFILLLPWIIFTSLLRHSRMYGQAGGISAVLGALLILGRKNYGSPDEFALARLTEVFIGLFWLIMVEIFLQPPRAATLAKIQLSRSLGTLQECIEKIVIYFKQEEKPDLFFLAMREQQRKLKSHVSDLKAFSGDAELEPDFWFLPFRASCYNKLHESLSKMVDLLHLMAYLLEFLLQISKGFGIAEKEMHEHMNKDLEIFKETISSSLKYLKKITSIKLLGDFQKDLQQTKVFHDLESGKSLNANVVSLSTTCNDEGEKILCSFILHSEEVTKKIRANEGKEELNVKAVLWLSSLGFCISGLMKEMKEIEKGVKELVRWENPSNHINLYEISCKLDVVYPK